LSDDDDIEREIRNMFVRSNTLTHKFSFLILILTSNSQSSSWSIAQLTLNLLCFGHSAYVCTILFGGMYTKLALYRNSAHAITGVLNCFSIIKSLTVIHACY